VNPAPSQIAEAMEHVATPCGPDREGCRRVHERHRPREQRTEASASALPEGPWYPVVRMSIGPRLPVARGEPWPQRRGSPSRPAQALLARAERAVARRRVGSCQPVGGGPTWPPFARLSGAEQAMGEALRRGPRPGNARRHVSGYAPRRREGKRRPGAARALQRYAGSILESSTCHLSPPSPGLGKPPGDAPVGRAWADAHHSYVEGHLSGYQPCHGTHSRGLAQERHRPRAHGTVVGGFACLYGGPGRPAFSAGTA